MTVDPAFYQRYEAIMARWPIPYHGVDVEGTYGTTHVNVCGEPDAPPVVLIPGGRSTSACWYATVGALAAGHRVYALDTLGDRGRSVRSEKPMRTIDAVLTWLDETLDGLGISEAAFGSHSLGANYASRYALHAPDRVTKLALFDPTGVLCGTPLRYYLRAVPLVVGGSPKRFRAFNRWESGDRVDAEFLDLWSEPFGGASGGAFPKRLSADEIARLTMPVLVFAAMDSKQNDPRKLIRGAARLPDGRVVELPGVRHFMLPQDAADAVNPELAKW
ncbi:MAG TPA: alpha/beta fold hydrolase [Micromonosporaceae bacterium]